MILLNEKKYSKEASWNGEFIQESETIQWSLIKETLESQEGNLCLCY